jgi:hypothetical protein
MFSTKKPIILILSLLLFSCGETIDNSKDTLEIDSSILSQTDSLLNIVDEEFEHIIHDSEIRNRKVNELEGRVEEYVNVIVMDKKEQSQLNSKIESLMVECQKKDSINKTLLLSIENLNYQIKKIEESKYYLNSQMKEQNVLYETEIYRLEDSLSFLNDKINHLELFIIDNTRKSKIEKERIFTDE